MDTISLDTYSIYIGNIWERLTAFLQEKNYSKVVVIVDENTEEYCLPILKEKIKQAFEIILIASGEQHKNLNTCAFIWSKMMALQLDRKSLTINLGGGVIGDMGGFCAATFKRGMDFIQMPTTLLSQVDASIGGKLGIDFQEIKNSIGLFDNPQGVFIHPDFLKTLSKREVKSGFAEMIKHSLIADAQQWAKIVNISSIEKVNWADYLVPSLKIKQQIVQEDPFEHGLRKALNFGHTIGHGIEGVELKSEHPFLHGEAIAIGMICEAYLSHKKAGLAKEIIEEIAAVILGIYGKNELNDALFMHYFLLMQNDKKNENDTINFTLLKGIGLAEINHSCTEDEIFESLAYYNSLCR